MTEGGCSDSPRRPLGETCIGPTSGNKERGAELELGQLNSANAASPCGRRGPRPALPPRGGAGRAAAPAGMPHAGLPPRPPQPKPNLVPPNCCEPRRRPVPQALESFSSTSRAASLRKALHTMGRRAGGRGREGEEEGPARRGCRRCGAPTVSPGGEGEPGPRTALRATSTSASPSQS